MGNKDFKTTCDEPGNRKFAETAETARLIDNATRSAGMVCATHAIRGDVPKHTRMTAFAILRDQRGGHGGTGQE
jgi:hypothetical protein